MLVNWNFQDEIANSTTQQINRQKSARNLAIIQIDPSEPRAVFFDTKRGVKSVATLTECNCTDFNFAGKGARKEFKPCMHIYRLAIELGLMAAKYLDREARHSLAAHLSREETQRLQKLPQDLSQWGGWALNVHESGIQRNRQYRAYFICCEESSGIQYLANGWRVHGYGVTLNRCECNDFFERRLPCKHIYSVAIDLKIDLPFTRSNYEEAKKQGLDIIFEFPATT